MKKKKVLKKEQVREIVLEEIFRSDASFDEKCSIRESGMDSIEICEFIIRLELRIGVLVPDDLLHELSFENVDGLTGALWELQKDA